MQFEFSKIKAIAKKEFMDNVRNKWVLALSVIFIILTLVMSYFTISATPSSISDVAFKGEWNPNTNTPELGDAGLGGEPYEAYFVSAHGNFTFDETPYEFRPNDLVVQVDSGWERLRFMGYWDASANMPPLSDNGGNGTQGEIYTVIANGTTPLDGHSDWVVGDFIVNWEDSWVKLEPAESDVGFKGYSETVASLSTIAAMLLPIIAIMLGYSSIIGERENGSMGVVLGCPVSRFDVILGKFLGLGAVLAATIFLGFGVSGVIVGAMAGFDDALAYLLFMVLTVLFATFFLGFSILMSAIASKRSTAIAGGLAIFFSGMIAGTVLMGVWVATGGDIQGMVNQAMQGVMPQLPDWYWAGTFFSFMDIYPMGAMDLFSTTDFMGFTMDYPWFVNAPIIFAWFLFLTTTTFLASVYVFGKKDI